MRSRYVATVLGLAALLCSSPGWADFTPPPSDANQAVSDQMLRQLEMTAPVTPILADQPASHVFVSLLRGTQRQDVQYRLELQQTADPNNRALPDGRIVLNSGLVRALSGNDSALAFAEARELAHVEAHDADRIIQPQLGSEGVAGALVYRTPQLVQRSILTAHQLLTLGYAPEVEAAADIRGLEMMQGAGYDPQGALDVLRWQEREEVHPGSLLPNHAPASVRYSVVLHWMGEHHLAVRDASRAESGATAVSKGAAALATYGGQPDNISGPGTATSTCQVSDASYPSAAPDNAPAPPQGQPYPYPPTPTYQYQPPGPSYPAPYSAPSYLAPGNAPYAGGYQPPGPVYNNGAPYTPGPSYPSYQSSGPASSGTPYAPTSTYPNYQQPGPAYNGSPYGPGSSYPTYQQPAYNGSTYSPGPSYPSYQQPAYNGSPYAPNQPYPTYQQPAYNGSPYPTNPSYPTYQQPAYNGSPYASGPAYQQGPAYNGYQPPYQYQPPGPSNNGAPYAGGYPPSYQYQTSTTGGASYSSNPAGPSGSTYTPIPPYNSPGVSGQLYSPGATAPAASSSYPARQFYGPGGYPPASYGTPPPPPDPPPAAGAPGSN